MLPEDLFLEREAVFLFGIAFPRLSLEEALNYVSSKIFKRQGIAVCFPDMSTLNLIGKNPVLGLLIEKNFLPLNDGIGLKIASKWEKRPFVENLNGTDFVPALFHRLKKGTSIFLVGSKPGVAEGARCAFRRLFPHLDFAGSAHGYLGNGEEERVVSQLKALKPDLVLVGMGNPLQLQWIDKQRQADALPQTCWLAVGGLFDFYGGGRKRAPKWMRTFGLEWFYIAGHEPHKFFRYALGVPLFLWNSLIRTLRRRHTRPFA